MDSSHINLLKIAGKIIETTATDTILKIIKRFKMGVDIPKLKDRTVFDGSKIRNILYQLSNQVKIKKISRDVYTLTQTVRNKSHFEFKMSKGRNI